MGKKNSTTTSTVSIPPEILARYNAVNKKAEAAAAVPFQKYGTKAEDFVAQMNAQQNAGIADINSKAGSYEPYMEAATSATQTGMGPAYAGINNYMSPYIQNVADTTGAMLRQANEQAQSGALGAAASSGAFGGDRAGVAAANLSNQQGMAYGKTMADIYNQGYTQALGASQADLARQMAGGAQMGALGAQSQQLALQGAQAKIAAGTMQQQTEQAGKDALIKQFMQEKGYPFQVAQFLANIAMGTGAQSGTTTATTQPLGIFGNLYAKGGSVGGYAKGGGVAGPRSSIEEGMWEEGYVPEADLPVGGLMVAETPLRERGNKGDDLMKLAMIAMGGAKNGGVINARHGYATDGGVLPLDRAEEDRVTGLYVPPTTRQQPSAEPRTATGVVAPTSQTSQPTGVAAPRRSAQDPVSFFNDKVIRQESGGRQLDENGNPLTSSAGAVGVAQVMEGTGPEAAKLAGVEWDRNRWLYDKEYNKGLGQAYFLHQFNKYGSLDKAAAAYNAGPGRLEEAMARAATEGGSYTDYLPAETQNYIRATTGMGLGAGNLTISSSGGLGGADMAASDKPYSERNMIGKFFRDPLTGRLNPVAVKSVLGGLAAMARSNTVSPISALLQGVGGGVEAYNAAEKQAADIDFTNAQTATAAVQLLKNSVYYDQSLGMSVIPLQGGGTQSFAEWLQNPAGPSAAGIAADSILRSIATNAARSGINLQTATPEELMGGATSVPAPGQPPSAGMPSPVETTPYESQGTFAMGDAERAYVAQAEAAARQGMPQAERDLLIQQSADTRFAADNGTAAASLAFRNNNELAATVARAAANNDLGPLGDVKARYERLATQLADVFGVQYDGSADTSKALLDKLSSLSADQMTADTAAAALYLQNKGIFPNIDTDPKAAAEITAEMLTKNMYAYDKGLYVNDLYRAQTGPVKSLVGADAMFNERHGSVYQGEKANIAELLKYAGTAEDESNPEIKAMIVDFFESANRGGFRDEADAQAALEEIFSALFSVLPGEHRVSSGLGRYFVQ